MGRPMCRHEWTVTRNKAAGVQYSIQLHCSHIPVVMAVLRNKSFMATRRMASLPYISHVRNKLNWSNRSILYEDYWAHMSWCEQESTAAGPECASLSKQSYRTLMMLKNLLLTYLPATGRQIPLPTIERPSWWSEALSSRTDSSSSKPPQVKPQIPMLCI